LSYCKEEKFNIQIYCEKEPPWFGSFWLLVFFQKLAISSCVFLSLNGSPISEITCTASEDKRTLKM
jgi:hypothetical protein